MAGRNTATKECTGCRTAIPVDGFYMRNGKPIARCKRCTSLQNKAWRISNPEHKRALDAAYYAANREEHNARSRAYQSENAESISARRREKYLANRGPWVAAGIEKHGITTADYMRMLDAQDWGCYVCGGVNANGSRLAIDHDHRCCEGSHSCGKCVRALLCYYCNATLGNARDDRARLLGLAEYLGQFEGVVLNGI